MKLLRAIVSKRYSGTSAHFSKPHLVQNVNFETKDSTDDLLWQTAKAIFPPLSGLTGIQKVQPNDSIWVAMSGGVDSSTSAGLLSRKFGPHNVKGVFMNNWSSTSKCQESSWRAVQEVCKHLKIECTRIDLERDYWNDVFEPMLQAYQQGSTPNPDVSCNQYIKFGNLITQLRGTDPSFKWLATGHYAGLTMTDEGSFVSRPQYKPKDQSYYLSTVPTSSLSHALFPLADLSKPQVRELAHAMGLVTVAQKPDSQGLCFVEQQKEFGKRGFHNFLSNYLEDKPGPIVLQTDLGQVVGEHRGLWTHTVGQRIGIAMPQSTMPGKWFVTDKDIARNALIVDSGRDAPAMYKNKIVSHDFTWHKEPSDSFPLFVQYRSLQDPWRVASWSKSGSIEFRFDVPRRAVSSGQFVVVYENDAVIGAGTIAETGSL